MKNIATFLAAFLVAAFSYSAWAHGDEDHSKDATPIATVGARAPHTSAQTEEFEMVAVLEAGKLTLTLDRFATNEPISDAEVEVESGAMKAVATQVTPGVYWVPGDAFTAPGKYPLTISVQAGDTADLLTATLDLPQQVAAIEEPVKSWIDWTGWGASGALLLTGAGLVARRREKNRNSEG